MTRRIRPVALLTLTLPLLLAGCGGTSEKQQAEADAKILVKPKVTEAEIEADIKKSLALLEPEDRKLAEAQRFCAYEPENRLGSMGRPIKLMIKDKPVFLCCGGCKKKSSGKEEQLLAKAEELKKKPAEPAK
jgi:predicted metal-dependent hydrolase